MAVLAEWLQRLIILVVFATFTQMLLPDNSLRRYTRLLIGLVIIAAVLSPALDLLQDNFDLNRTIFTISDRQAVNSEALIEQGQLMASKAEERLANMVRPGIEDQMCSLVRLVPGVIDAAVTINHDPVSVTVDLWLDGEADGNRALIQPVQIEPGSNPRASLNRSEVEKKARQLLITYFGLTDSLITVRMHEGR